MPLENTYCNKLPFIIGITGHRDLISLKSKTHTHIDIVAIKEQIKLDIVAIKEQIKRALIHWRNQFGKGTKTEPNNTPIWILSGMADGADLLVIQAAEELWAEQAAKELLTKESWPKASLKVIPCLPMDESAFEKDFSDSGLFTACDFSETLDKYRNNLIQLRHGLTQEQYQFAQNDLNYGELRNSLYLNLGVFIAKYSNVLIALWDEDKADSMGGTGDVVRLKCGLSAQWPLNTENKALTQISDFDGQLGGVVHHIPVNRKKKHRKSDDNIILTRVDKTQGKTVFPTEHLDCKLYISHKINQSTSISAGGNDDIQSFLTEEFITLIQQLNEYNNQNFSEFDISQVEPQYEEELAVQQLSLRDSFQTFKCADETAMTNQKLYRKKVLWFVSIAILGFTSYELVSGFLDNILGIMLNSLILIAIILCIVIKTYVKKSKSKWLYQLTRGVAESMRLRSFLNLADISPTKSPLVPRRYRKRLPLLAHAIEVTELNWWKYPIKAQLESVNKHWLKGQISFIESRLKISSELNNTKLPLLSKIINAVKPRNINIKLEIFLYKRPAKTEQTLSSLTTILFRLTCISVFGLFFAQIVFFNGGLLPFIDLTKSTLLMYPIQFTLLLTAIAALWNEFANYGPTANGYFNLLELYKRAENSLSKNKINDDSQSASVIHHVYQELKALNKKLETDELNNCPELHLTYKSALQKIQTGFEQSSIDVNKEAIDNLLVELAKEAMQEHAEWNHFESLSDLKNKK
ncbi:hypothetical protein [Colwellia sp. BRX9-1]|uniref:hypothetical protein n=1 Tax=Colwellia sp. BRX9-1 TaxID=2759830 RepID=UPI0015F41401|nr:hypothetical protein [Colwellia sp. BRX9-1]MBA6352716.1 hypothetical protein [Colwellia sp. BRX9-1]